MRRDDWWRWLRTSVVDSRYVAEPEWLIGLGRLVTSIFAAVALYFDPTQPSRLAEEARLLTLAYVAFSLLALLPLRRPHDSKLHLLTHSVDVLVLGWLLHLTDELTSPFFAFFNFTVFAATIRWGITGALLGACVLEGLLLVIGLPDLEDGVSELNLVIMQSAYFFVSAVMLGYFGAYRNRSRYRLERLAAWPLTKPALGDKTWLAALLRHAADVVGSDLLLVLWHDYDEAVGTIAVWNSGELTISAEGGADVLTALEGPEARSAEELRQLWTSASARMSVAHFGRDIEHGCSASFAGVRYHGRLIVANARFRHEEVDSLANIVADRIGEELERMALMLELASNVRVQERARLARNLHDSVLQNLTAANLKLKSIARQLPAVAAPAVDEVALIMVDQQRRIRRFLEDACSGETPVALADALRRHVQLLRAQWGCEIALNVEPGMLQVTLGLSRELAHILSEATANAVRHGRAGRIDVSVSQTGELLRLELSDDGTGLPKDLGSPLRKPSSLAARVADLAGSLSITRYRPGFAMLIDLPIR